MAFSTDVVTACKGASFLLCTDGLLEVANKANAEFGIEGMKGVLSSTGHEPLNSIVDRVFAPAKAFGYNDHDKSLLLIRC
jgi:serine phosphatase RsbU (regulator of sigma subunit)